MAADVADGGSGEPGESRGDCLRRTRVGGYGRAVNLDAARTRSSAGGSYEEYHPYGSTAWWAGSSGLVSQKRYRFTGMERDEETGLQCHGVRYYAVWLGRWVSADPIGLGDGVNRFGYCHGDPAGGRDNSGTRDYGAEEDIKQETSPPTLSLPPEKVTGQAQIADEGPSIRNGVFD